MWENLRALNIVQCYTFSCTYFTREKISGIETGSMQTQYDGTMNGKQQQKIEKGSDDVRVIK